MTTLGRNLKIDVDATLRDTVRRFYEEGLGCTRRSPAAGLDLFDFEAGGCLGVFYVDGGALDPSLWTLALWLEFEVDDPDDTAAKLVSLGAVRVLGRTDHPYLQAPGGPVFRLAPRSR